MAARYRAACVAVSVVLLVTACGVEAQPAPEPVPAGRLPSASPSAAAPSTASRGQVWGARDGRLVPVFAELQGTGTAARVRAVLSLADPDERLPSALPPGTRLLRITGSGDRVVLTLSEELRTVPAADLPLALAQLVFTVTERSDVRRVHVRADREPIVYVDATGRRVDRPLVRSDFAELAPGEAPD